MRGVMLLAGWLIVGADSCFSFPSNLKRFSSFASIIDLKFPAVRQIGRPEILPDEYAFFELKLNANVAQVC